MAQGRTRTLACIAPNLTDYTFASIIEGAERQAYSQGYFLFSATATDPQAFGTLVDELIASRRADGLMVINPYADERYKYMPQSAPVVFIGAYPRHEQVSAVALDDHVAGYVATQHLVMLGHRCIMHITGPLSEDCSRERYQGYQQAMSEACIPAVCDLVVEGDWSATSGYEAVKRILGQGGQFSALIAQNDRMAIGALRALREASLAVPRDISVIGFDDMPLASYFDPPLTTMRQDTHQIGQQAARLLIRSIEEPDTPRQFLRLDAELVLRATTCSLL
jgi:DNA-binding LacI/PurR family transcriptional regulator